MPIYVLMTKLAPGSMQDAQDRSSKGKDWLQKVSKACPDVKWLAHYSLLGPYDFMDMYEAPNDMTAYKISLISRKEGAVSAESWPAIPYEEHLKLLGQIGV